MKYILILLSCATLAHASESWRVIEKKQFLDPDWSQENRVAAVVCDLERKLLAAAFAGSCDVIIFDTQTALPKARLAGSSEDAVTVLALDPKKKQLAVGDHAGNVSVWRACGKSWIEEHQLPTQVGGVDCLAFSPKDDLLVVAHRGEISLWKPKTGSLLRTLYMSGDCVSNYGCGDFDREGKKILLSAIAHGCDSSGVIEIWDVSNGKCLTKRRAFDVKVLPKGAAVAWHPNGKEYLVGSGKGVVDGYQMDESEAPVNFCFGDNSAVGVITGLVYSADGSNVLMVDSSTAHLIILDPKARKFSRLVNPNKKGARSKFFDFYGNDGSAMVVDSLNRLVCWEKDRK